MVSPEFNEDVPLRECPMIVSSTIQVSFDHKEAGM